MKRILFLTVTILFTGCQLHNKAYFTTREIAQFKQPNQINWVSIESIEQSLQGKKPIAVGFDIDDTVILSSPVTHMLRQQYPDIKDDKTIPDRYELINCRLVKYFLPKESAYKIIQMHQRRGDSIYFITARRSADCVKNNAYSMKEYLQETFAIENMHDVIYSGPSKAHNAKTRWLKDKKIKIYYGDDDQDIEAAIEAGIKGIRVMRPSISKKSTGNRIGFYDEWVLKGSDY